MKSDFGLLLLRLTFGLIMFFSHGLPKLMNFSTKMNVFPDPIGLGNSLSLGLAIFAEVFCALLIAFGLFTRLATIPLIITMAVAVFIVHAGHPWAKIELGLIYLLGFTVIAILGGGSFSLDRVWRRKP